MENIDTIVFYIILSKGVLTDLTTFWGKFTYIFEPCWESLVENETPVEGDVESIITLTLQLNVAQILTW